MMRYAVFFAMLGAGCVGGGAGTDLFETAPDFSLVDVNDTSQTFGESVSPRDARGQISAWYFGHSS